MVKSRLNLILQDFFRVSVSFLPLIPVIRLLEYMTLTATHNLPAGSGSFILSGLWSDLLVFLSLTLLALGPFILIALLSRKAANMVWLILLILYACFHFALIKYFSVTLVPLDQVVFSYSLREMVMISASSTRFSLMTFLPFLLLMILLPASWLLLRKLNPGTRMPGVFLAAAFIAPFLFYRYHPKPDSYVRDLEYFLTVNKPGYLAQKCIHHLRFGNPDTGLPDQSPDPAMLKQVELYHALHPEFSFTGPTFPLLHPETTPDVLSPFFTLGDVKPNLVFVIVESLSSAFCGERPYLGSFTPFLDSLAKTGLYWQNCLATSERTFFALPAIFSSQPYGSGACLDNLTRSAYHQSLIRYLSQNGYTTRFFYGGDPSFNQMDNFLRRNHTDFILTTWGPAYSAQQKAESGFKWGYPDHELFRRSFEIMDSMKTSPYLDIYLTLSMHAPFIPPDQKKYTTLYEQRVGGASFTAAARKEAEKYRDIYTTILYTDDALRAFFREYTKRPEYANTIFFITGDHALPELNIGWYSPMEPFRVPLIVWSPMLNRHANFASVITHHDVTPSVLALLKGKYPIETHPLAQWLGTGLDTSRSFRAERSIVFTLNNKEMVDFLDGEYCFSKGRLYRIRPDMQADPLEDPVIREKMSKKLKNYVAVTEYAGSSNRLIPVWMLFPKTITGTELPVGDGVGYSGQATSEEFVTILKKYSFPEELKYITFSASFRLFSEEAEEDRIPRLVFDLSDSSGTSRVWNQYALFKPGSYRAGQWNTVSFSESMDLSYIKDLKSCVLRMYLWNTSGITLKCDSLVRTLRGYR